MTDDDVQIVSVAGELTSGIRESSARMMEAAYLPRSTKKRDVESGAPFFKTPPLHQDEEVPGPGARIYITKISNRTPDKDVKGVLGQTDERKIISRTHDFYTILFYVNIHLNEPSTTRFINATVSVAFSPGNKILDYSPKEKEIIANIAETAGEEIFLTPALDLSASFPHRGAGNPDDPRSRFEVRVGPEEKIPFTYSTTQGYSLCVPKRSLLEYEGMRKNEREVYWEMYPPMPPRDREITGKGMHAFLSLIVQFPRFSFPEVVVRIAGKVKGEIWGVVPVESVLEF